LGKRGSYPEGEQGTTIEPQRMSQPQMNPFVAGEAVGENERGVRLALSVAAALGRGESILWNDKVYDRAKLL
jgi:hypothetical protein